MDQNEVIDAPMPPRRAYSYVRFSTPEQKKGGSHKRQRDMALDYARRHGLELDDTLHLDDEGISGFRGRNFVEGSLSRFVEHVESGEVPKGSLLLVESLDRISRQQIGDAQFAFLNLLRSGVTVVTLADEAVYNWDQINSGSGMSALIVSLAILFRAHEESATKSHRMRKSWESKRTAAAELKPVTARLPAWLRLSEDRQVIEQIPERVQIVKRIFKMALAGDGHVRISSTLNQEGVQPWGPGRSKGAFWHRSYISKLLANPAVIGHFTPHVMEFDGHLKSRRPLETVEGYFPAIISLEDFHEVQVIRQAHAAPSRGRHAHAPITNVLAGLATCSKCGATMTRVAKGKRSRPAYVCTRAKGGAGCEYRSIRCDLVEAAVLQRLPERLRELDGATANVEDMSEAIEVGEGQLVGLEKRVEFYLDELFHEPSEDLRQALREKLRQLQAQQEEARKTLQGLQEQREIASGLTVKARVQRVLEALEPPEGDPIPADVNKALRLIFKRAVLHWSTGAIDLEWHHGGTCTLHFTTFTNQPGPGWRWEESEDSNDDNDHQAA